MKLSALNAHFIGAGGDGVFNSDGGVNRQVKDGLPWGWQRTGETLDTLTLSPSVQRGEPCPKRWHGYIRNGEAVPC